MKYKIIIEKEPEQQEGDTVTVSSSRFRDFDVYKNPIGIRMFYAEMDSDSCIEILQHLHYLKDNRKSG